MAWTKAQSATQDPNGVLFYFQEIVTGVNEKILNFSDVGLGHRFDIFSIRLIFATTATVGPRAPVVQLQDDTGAILLTQIAASRTVAASSSLTLQYGLDLDVAVPDHERLPRMEMGRNVRLRVTDGDAIDSADTLSVWLVGIARG